MLRTMSPQALAVAQALLARRAPMGSAEGTLSTDGGTLDPRYYPSIDPALRQPYGQINLAASGGLGDPSALAADRAEYNQSRDELGALEGPGDPSAVSADRAEYDQSRSDLIPRGVNAVAAALARKKGAPMPAQPMPATHMRMDYAPESGAVSSPAQGAIRNVLLAENSPAAAPMLQLPSNAKPLTEQQSKDAIYVTRALGSMPLLDKYGSALTDWVPQAAGSLPFGWGAGLQSADYQRAHQAGMEFLQALLRKDTGAQITQGEMNEYGLTYLPNPGDKPQVLEQKRASRARAVMALQLGLPPDVTLALEKAGMKPVTPDQAVPKDAASALKNKYGLE